MRGKKAKRLRLQAKKYVHAVMGKPLTDGYNEYFQVDNRMSMEPVLDAEGMPRKDEGGQYMLAPKKIPGTVHCAWHVRVIYKLLKRNNGRVRTAT